MKRNGSKIADNIVKDFKNENKYKKQLSRTTTINEFREIHCKYCKNKNTNLCEIRKKINNKYSCIYEEK